MASSTEKQEPEKASDAIDEDITEAILKHVGEMGRYQKFLFFSMLPFGVIFAFVYLGQMFVTPTPQRYWCWVPELKDLEIETRRNFTTPGDGKTWDRCLMYDANWTEVLTTMVPPDPATPTVPCRYGWEFELGDIPYHTVVSERGWVCNNAGIVPIATALFFIGAIFGGIGLGWMADRFGRVPAFVAANMVGAIGTVATMFTTGVYDFYVCRFIVGMSYDSCFMLLYILVLEYVGPRHRTCVANLAIAFFFGGGCIILPWIALAIGDWRYFLLVTAIPMSLVLLAPLMIPESIRWLVHVGKVNRAVKILRKFEKVNKRKIPQEAIDEFLIASRRKHVTDESIRALLRSSPLRFMLICMVIVYMGCSILFDGLVRMSENLGLDFFITFTLTSATEVPSTSLLVVLLDRWGRRNLTCGPLITAGILVSIAAFVSKGAPQVTLATIARFFINMSFNAGIQWATELLPTGVRASGSSVVHVSGFVASILSPFIVFSDRLWGPLPLVILGIIGIVSGLIGLLIPETMGQSMPQTIAEGEKLVRENSLFRSKSRKPFKEGSKTIVETKDAKELINKAKARHTQNDKLNSIKRTKDEERDECSNNLNEQGRKIVKDEEMVNECDKKVNNNIFER